VAPVASRAGASADASLGAAPTATARRRRSRSRSRSKEVAAALCRSARSCCNFSPSSICFATTSISSSRSSVLERPASRTDSRGGDGSRSLPVEPRSRGGGRPCAGVATAEALADADWFVGAGCWDCWLGTFFLPLPFPLGPIRTQIFVRSPAFSLATFRSIRNWSHPSRFSFKYSQPHPGRSGESLQCRASSVSLAWTDTPQPWYRELHLLSLPPPRSWGRQHIPPCRPLNHCSTLTGQAPSGGGNNGDLGFSLAKRTDVGTREHRVHGPSVSIPGCPFHQGPTAEAAARPVDRSPRRSHSHNKL